MAYVLGEQIQNTEADRWASFVGLNMRKDFNYIGFESMAQCKKLKDGGNYYVFEFRDGSVMVMVWNELDKRWDEWLTYIQPYAVADLKRRRAESARKGRDDG